MSDEKAGRLDAGRIKAWYEREVNEAALGGTVESEILVTVPALCDALEASVERERELRRALTTIKRGTRNASKNASYGGTRWVQMTKREMQQTAERALARHVGEESA